MRDVAHSAASPDQAPYAVAEAVFADAKAYLSSREAQQMSESELERELHRRGQGVDTQAPARTPRSTHPGRGRRSGRGGRRCRALAAAPAATPPGDDLRDGAGCAPGWVALVDGAETPIDLASAAVDLTVWQSTSSTWPSTSARRCLCSIATGVSKGRAVPGSRPDGVHWCTPVLHRYPCFIHARVRIRRVALGWSRGGSEAPGATKPAATSMRTGTSTTREYQRHHAQRYADGIA